MPDDTLSPVAFAAKRVRTALPPAERHALARLGSTCGHRSDAETLRFVVESGLAVLGWQPERRVKEYEAYVEGCQQDGVVNQYEKARS